MVKITTSFFADFTILERSGVRRLRIHDSAEEFAAARLAGAVGEARVVGEDGADAGEHRVGFVTQMLNGVARLLAGDLSLPSGFLRNLAVEGERGFQSDERAFGLNPPGEVFVVTMGASFHGRRAHRDSRAL